MFFDQQQSIWVPTPSAALNYQRFPIKAFTDPTFTDPTLDPSYVQGGGSDPTYTPPSQWGHNLGVPVGGATDSTWLWVALAAVVGFALVFGGRR